MKRYDALKELGKHIRVLTGINQHLEWDLETYMPPGATSIRALQVETLSGLIHEARTGEKFKTLLGGLIDLKTGKVKGSHVTAMQRAALREWRRDYMQEKMLPKKFVTDFAALSSKSVMVWRQAKETSNFSLFAPFLKKLVDMAKKKADYLGYKDHPYDALLNTYEPEMTVGELEKIFSPLQETLLSLLHLQRKKKPVDDRCLQGKVSAEEQLAFSKRLLMDMGYDFNYGRLDLSSHPFSSAPHPTDSRITTRIHPSCFVNNLLTTLHEAGHALYEMGLPKTQYGTPLGDAASLGIHESQSRWWETRIGLSKPFWIHYFPLLKQAFAPLANVSFTTFYSALNKVEPSFIRVDADEVTYPLHVMLRFDLEKRLIEGSLRVQDVREAWNGKMKELLDIKPSSDAEGCLQDIHWAMGVFGYFPTYALGNLYAAHLFEAFAKEYPDWEERVGRGELQFISAWLYEKVHKHGRRYLPKELLKKATGRVFTPVPYIRYLQEKFGWKS